MKTDLDQRLVAVDLVVAALDITSGGNKKVVLRRIEDRGAVLKTNLNSDYTRGKCG
jgi:hypothetical protein